MNKLHELTNEINTERIEITNIIEEITSTEMIDMMLDPSKLTTEENIRIRTSNLRQLIQI